MHWAEYANQIGKAMADLHSPSLYALVLNLQRARETGATVFTCGNGGSASNASHLAQDLSKGTLVNGKPPLRTNCLCDNISAVTAWANDEGYDCIFSEQLYTLGRKGDILLAISGSGNSENVLNAVHAAHELEMRTWGITGFDGGKLLSLAHRCVRVPSDDMGRAEAVHSILFHWLVDALKEMPEAATAGAWCPGVEP